MIKVLILMVNCLVNYFLEIIGIKKIILEIKKKNENLNHKIISINNERQLKKFKFDFIEKEIYIEKCYFFEDFSKRIVAIIFFILGFYLVAIILTFFLLL